MGRDLLDPKTRKATAFYAAVAVAVYDVIQRGFHFWSALILSSAAGLTAFGVMAAMVLRRRPPDPE